MPSPTLLYARHHGLTIDHRSLDPFQLLGGLINKHRGKIHYVPPRAEEAAQDEADNLRTSLLISLSEQKMTVTLEQARHLQDAIKSSDLSRLSDTQRWHLPDRYHRIANLKLEVPLILLGDGIAGGQRDVDRVKSGIDIDAAVRSVLAGLPHRKEHSVNERSSSTMNLGRMLPPPITVAPTAATTFTEVGNGIEWSHAAEMSAWVSYFEQCSDEVWQQIRDENLEVRHEVLLRLQHALGRPTQPTNEAHPAASAMG